MCKCIDNLVKTLTTNFGEVSKNKNPKLKTLEDIYPQADMLSGKTFSIFYAHIKEKKSPIEINVFHTYCPFCGSKQ